MSAQRKLVLYIFFGPILPQKDVLTETMRIAIVYASFKNKLYLWQVGPKDFLLNPILYIVTSCIYVYYFVDCYMYTKEIKFTLSGAY